MTWQAIITSAGDDDVAFEQAGLVGPKNWQTFSGKSLIEMALDSATDGAAKSTLVIRDVEKKRWEDSELISRYQNLGIVYTKGVTGGALCTALLGLANLDLEAPLLIFPGDASVTENTSELVSRFMGTEADAGTLVMQSTDQKYSYVRFVDSERIAEIAEKRVISNFASTGIFFFRKAGYLLDAGEWVLSQNMSTHGEFYLSASLNYIVMQGRKVVALDLPETDHYTRLATPEEFFSAKGTEDAD